MKILEVLIKSNVYISLCASSLYVYYALTLEKNFFVSTVVSIFTGTSVAYFFVRWIGKQRERQSFELPSTAALCYLTTLSCISLYGLKNLNLSQVVISLSTLVLILTYERFFFTKKSLRAVPYTKPFIISLAWTNTCVFLHYEALTTSFLVSSIECFCFIFILCLLFDFKDIKEDKVHGLKSITHLLSLKQTIWITYILLIIIFLIREPHKDWALTTFSLFIMSLFYFLGVKLRERETIFAFFIDGIILVKCFLYFHFI